MERLSWAQSCDFFCDFAHIDSFFPQPELVREKALSSDPSGRKPGLFTVVLFGLDSSLEGGAGSAITGDTVQGEMTCESASQP